MGIFKAPKAGSQSNELIVGRLTGVMDLKIFYKGKNRGEDQSLTVKIGISQTYTVLVMAKLKDHNYLL